MPPDDQVPPSHWPYRPPPYPPWSPFPARTGEDRWQPEPELPEPTAVPPAAAVPQAEPVPAPTAVPPPSPVPPATSPPVLKVGAPPNFPPVSQIEWTSHPRTMAMPEAEPATETLLGACLVYIAAIALIVAAFLPWLERRGIQVDGWHSGGDARFLFALGIVGMLVATAIIGAWDVRPARWLLFIGGIAVIGVSGADLWDAHHVSSDIVVAPHPGSGIWLALAAGFVLVASVWLLRPAKPSRSSPAHQEPRDEHR